MSRENSTQEEQGTLEQGRSIERAELSPNFSGAGLREMLSTTSQETATDVLRAQEEDAKAIESLRAGLQSSVADTETEETHESPDRGVGEVAAEEQEVIPKTPADLFEGFANSLKQTNPSRAAHYQGISTGLRVEGGKKIAAMEDAILVLEELVGNRFASETKKAQHKLAFDELQGEYEKLTGAPYDPSTMSRIGKFLGAGFRSLLRPPEVKGRGVAATPMRRYPKP